MHTLAQIPVAGRAGTGLRQFVIRYRAFLYVATLLLVAVLALADRRGGAIAPQAAVSSAAGESAVPADLNDRPLNLPDR